jgi:hypothetical protein
MMVGQVYNKNYKYDDSTTTTDKPPPPPTQHICSGIWSNFDVNTFT